MSPSRVGGWVMSALSRIPTSHGVRPSSDTRRARALAVSSSPRAPGPVRPSGSPRRPGGLAEPLPLEPLQLSQEELRDRVEKDSERLRSESLVSSLSPDGMDSRDALRPRAVPWHPKGFSLGFAADCGSSRAECRPATARALACRAMQPTGERLAEVLVPGVRLGLRPPVHCRPRPARAGFVASAMASLSIHFHRLWDGLGRDSDRESPPAHRFSGGD